ncbi:hypothetical protein HD554DRAFT_2133704 [Boletus coccyginus]|nr:hypothetical protein HD554DRAFT_2133704 [Boletus coccyginus]
MDGAETTNLRRRRRSAHALCLFCLFVSASSGTERNISWPGSATWNATKQYVLWKAVRESSSDNVTRLLCRSTSSWRECSRER